jgi:hypothetical protein
MRDGTTGTAGRAPPATAKRPGELRETRHPQFPTDRRHHGRRAGLVRLPNARVGQGYDLTRPGDHVCMSTACRNPIRSYTDRPAAPPNADPGLRRLVDDAFHVDTTHGMGVRFVAMHVQGGARGSRTPSTGCPTGRRTDGAYGAVVKSRATLVARAPSRRQAAKVPYTHEPRRPTSSAAAASTVANSGSAVTDQA